MGSSIQELLKKINSKLTFTDCLSIFVTALVISVFSGYVYYSDTERRTSVSYLEREYDQSTKNIGAERVTQVFASAHGKTYTFSWCQGANRIKESNRVYFSHEQEAIRTGRTLSLLCKK
jgi:hypothetical protein